MKKISKKIVVGLLSLSLAGASVVMPEVKVGNLTIGTEQVEASSKIVRNGGRWTEYNRGSYRLSTASRTVTRWNVYNRNGRFMYSYYTYSAWRMIPRG